MPLALQGHWKCHYKERKQKEKTENHGILLNHLGLETNCIILEMKELKK